MAHPHNNMPIWAAYLPKLLLELGLLLVFLSYFGLPTLNNYLEGKVLTVRAEQLIKMMMLVIILEGADHGKQDGERRSFLSSLLLLLSHNHDAERF